MTLKNCRLGNGDRLVNKYTQIEIQILSFNEDMNWYEAVRVTDGRSIAVGVNWSNFYELADGD